MFWMTAFLDLAPDEFDRGGGVLAGRDRLRPVAGARRARRVRDAGPAGRRRAPARPAARRRSEPGAPRPARGRPGGGHGRGGGARALVWSPGTSSATSCMASPGGFTFCFVREPLSRPAPPTDWGGGLMSVVDQVCLDVPEPAYETEFGFWRALTGWEERQVHGHPEFRRLIRPAGPAAAAPGPAARASRRARCARTSTSPPATSRPRSNGTARSARAWPGSATAGR